MISKYFMKISFYYLKYVFSCVGTCLFVMHVLHGLLWRHFVKLWSCLVPCHFQLHFGIPKVLKGDRFSVMLPSKTFNRLLISLLWKALYFSINPRSVSAWKNWFVIWSKLYIQGAVRWLELSGVTGWVMLNNTRLIHLSTCKLFLYIHFFFFGLSW